jgi:hypothetical protein
MNDKREADKNVGKRDADEQIDTKGVRFPRRRNL